MIFPVPPALVCCIGNWVSHAANPSGGCALQRKECCRLCDTPQAGNPASGIPFMELAGITARKEDAMGFSAIAARQLDQYVGRSGFLLVDVRSPEQFREGHICGAYNLPYAQLREQMYTLPKGSVLVCYCERGGSSLKAARELSRAGYEVISVAGGLEAYHGKYLDTCNEMGSRRRKMR